MLETAPSVTLTLPVVPGDYVTHPLQLGTVNFSQPEPFSSTVVDEIMLRIEQPNSAPVANIDGAQYVAPQIEFFRRFDQWFATILLQGRSIPLAPLHLLLTHFDRINRKVYTAQGILTLTKYI